MSLQLAQTLVDALPTRIQSRFVADQSLESALNALLLRAVEEHDFAIAPDVFIRHVANHLPEDADIASLEALFASDLYLALACALGKPDAVGFLQQRWGPAVRHAISRRAQFDQVDDLCQQLWTRLLVAEEMPVIAKYSGRSKLSTWLQSVATRHALSFQRSRGNRIRTTDDNIEDAIRTDDPELEALKLRYRGAFKRAFQTAFEQLTVRQRNIMRHEFIDGLNIDRIGALYNVHRSTAARWRAETRRTLLAATRASFEAEHQVNQSEVDSILRLIDSQLDVSLTRLLRKDTSPK